MQKDITKLKFCVLTGITGHVRIDAVGDRDADYAILDLDPVTGKFEVFLLIGINFFELLHTLIDFIALETKKNVFKLLLRVIKKIWSNY